jgi:hypothetical protein
MKIMRTSFVIFLLLPLAFRSMAQPDRLHASIMYNYGLPSGSLKNDVVSTSSPRGFAVDLQYTVQPSLSVGLGVAWQDYLEKYPRALYQTAQNEITSAVLTNSVRLIPVLVKARYLPLAMRKSAAVQPFITAGAGVGMVNFEQYLGQFGGADTKVRFAWQGGVGAKAKFSKTGRSGLVFGANYTSVGYNKFQFGSFNSINFQTGIFLPLD